MYLILLDYNASAIQLFKLFKDKYFTEKKMDVHAVYG